MDAETKLRMLASGDANLQAIFGTPVFRWSMFGQLQQGYIQKGTCARVRRISTQPFYAQDGQLSMEKIRFQFDIMDYDSAKTFTAAAAVGHWFRGVDLMSDAQFSSPTTTPRQFPNFRMNQRSGIEAGPEQQIYLQIVDWMVFNDFNI